MNLLGHIARLRFVILATIAIPIVGLLFDTSMRLEVHQETTRVLREIERIEVVINRDLLELRHGHQANFDSLVASKQRAHERVQALSDLTKRLYRGDAEAGALDCIDSLCRLLDRRHALLERFKTESAVLNNSLRYFPDALGRAMAKLSVEDESGKAVQELSALAVHALDPAIGGSEASIEELTAAMRQTMRETGISTNGSGPVPALWQLALAMERQKTSVNGVLREATRMSDFRARVDAIEHYLDETRSQLEAASSRYWLLLLLLGVLGLVTTVTAWTGMQASKAAMQRMNETLERRILERTTELEEASRAKTDFLANMSHEIRTPMTAILGYADMLEDEEQSEADRNDCIATIRRNGHFLLSIINDVLDISKIEAGKMTVERIETEPREIIDGVENMMGPKAREQGLEFRMEWPEQVPRRIYTDPMRLTQILVNLVGNALKFTKKGHISVRVDFAPEQPERMRIEVQDSGVGIPADRVDHLFEAFSQADTSTTRRFGGTGLGLTISGRLAQLLGGSITVTSEEGSGSTFTVETATGLTECPPEDLTAGTAAPRARTATARAQTRTRYSGHVLLVEDGLDNQRLISRILSKKGLQVSIAENGAEACEHVLERDRSDIDLILMDMQMPVMDGYEAASTLRNAGCTLPVIALTAHAMETDRQRCLDAGCDDYLTKPVNVQRIGEVLAKHLPEDRSSA